MPPRVVYSMSLGGEEVVEMETGTWTCSLGVPTRVCETSLVHIGAHAVVREGGRARAAPCLYQVLLQNPKAPEHSICKAALLGQYK